MYKYSTALRMYSQISTILDKLIQNCPAHNPRQTAMQVPGVQLAWDDIGICWWSPAQRLFNRSVRQSKWLILHQKILFAYLTHSHCCLGWRAGELYAYCGSRRCFFYQNPLQITRESVSHQEHFARVSRVRQHAAIAIDLSKIKVRRQTVYMRTLLEIATQIALRLLPGHWLSLATWQPNLDHLEALPEFIFFRCDVEKRRKER